MSNESKVPLRLSISVGVFQLLIGISAAGGGYGLMVDPSGESLQIPQQWLEGSPFKDYFVPGLVLFLVNGLGNLAAAIVTFRRRTLAGLLAILLGAFMIAWIVVQVAIIGYASWLQPTYFTVGLFEAGAGVALMRARIRA